MRFNLSRPQKLVKAAKTVQVVKPGQKEEVVPGENLNAIRLAVHPNVETTVGGARLDCYMAVSLVHLRIRGAV